MKIGKSIFSIGLDGNPIEAVTGMMLSFTSTLDRFLWLLQLKSSMGDTTNARMVLFMYMLLSCKLKVFLQMFVFLKRDR